jgi:4a-hydroxytetrahydrobiopterin dehydratase
METLTDEQIDERLCGELSGWSREGATIVRDHRVADFAAAIALVGAVAEVAEAQGHHPDILVHGWNRLRLTLSTHSAGGLTAADFTLAEGLEALLR